MNYLFCTQQWLRFRYKHECIEFLFNTHIVMHQTTKPFWPNILAGPNIVYVSKTMQIIVFVTLVERKIKTSSTVLIKDSLAAFCTYVCLFGCKCTNFVSWNFKDTQYSLFFVLNSISNICFS